MLGGFPPCLPAAEASLVSSAGVIGGSSGFESPQPLNQLIDANKIRTAKKGSRLNIDHSAFSSKLVDAGRFNDSNGSHVTANVVFILL